MRSRWPRRRSDASIAPATRRGGRRRTARCTPGSACRKATSAHCRLRGPGQKCLRMDSACGSLDSLRTLLASSADAGAAAVKWPWRLPRRSARPTPSRAAGRSRHRRTGRQPRPAARERRADATGRAVCHRRLHGISLDRWRRHDRRASGGSGPSHPPPPLTAIRGGIDLHAAATRHHPQGVP